MSSHKLFRVYTCEALQGSLSVLVTIVPWPAKSLQVTGVRGLHLCEAEIVSSCLEVERQRCGKCRTSEFQELLGSMRAVQGAASRAGQPGLSSWLCRCHLGNLFSPGLRALFCDTTESSLGSPLDAALCFLTSTTNSVHTPTFQMSW